MARIDRAEVERIAELARLELTPAEAERTAAELAAILGYVEQLAALDTDAVEPTSHPLPLPTPLREDRAEPPLDPALALANAPVAEGFAFVVPKVLDEDEG
ncbi:MAG TPA: Asp-tRNA(Asn)/Glu-tRNA(Gln) amidotransferase subunit GatC [Myxococcota bacterium]|jgi:aspartyl-tRNA(Asn)/glutamyl-tRNA(Gln) amidotransferase subunit C